MNKFAFTAAALAFAAVAAPAVAAPAYSFERNGIRYAYDLVEENGATVIVGSEIESGKAFRLRLNDQGKVQGRYGNEFVSFAAPEAAGSLKLASK